MIAMTYFMLSPRGEAGVVVCAPCPSQMQGVGVGGHAHLGHIQAHGLLVARHADALELVLDSEERVHETKGPRHDDSDRDQLGAVSVHGVNGLWGLIALGLFADGSYGDGEEPERDE